MNDVDQRLRQAAIETRSAFETQEFVPSEVDRRGRSPLLPALMGVAVVFLGIGLPAFLLASRGPEATSGDQGAPETSSSPATETTQVVVTIDSDLLIPGPEDVEAILADAETAASVHSLGWRPAMSSEFVWCLYEDGPGAATYASNSPLEEPLSIDDLILECNGNNDPARNLESPPAAYTVCRGVLTRSAYEERISADEQLNLQENLAEDPPGFPVILGWESDCSSENLETNPSATLTKDLSIDVINQVRDIEIAVRGAAIREDCPTSDSRALATAIRSELGNGWVIGGGGGDYGCGVSADLQWGFVQFRN